MIILIEVIIIVIIVFFVSFFLIVGEMVFMFGLELYLFLKWFFKLVIFFLFKILIICIIFVLLFFFVMIMLFVLILRDFILCCILVCVMVWFVGIFMWVLFVKLIFRFSLNIVIEIILIMMSMFENVKNVLWYLIKLILFYIVGKMVVLLFLFKLWICFFFMLK